MLRRRLAPEPYAASATGGRGCAALGAVLAGAAVLLGRGGGEPRVALALLALALALAVAGAALALWSAGTIWRTGRRGVGRMLTALVISAAVLAYPSYLAALAVSRPPDLDASTDPATPPPFSGTPAAVAARGGAQYPDPPADAREAARRLPAVQPVMLDLPEDQAYDLALRAVQGRGWRVVEAAPPRGKFGTGHIDAVALTRVMALPEDVTVRVRPSDGQARVDIRSASRFGRLGSGENAARVQSLSDELLDADS